MGDADDSYDFLELPKFVEKLREGYDLVQGCRLPVRRRHGHARRDAVPAPLVGQPDVLGDGARAWFWAPVHDVYCGLRGFTKDLSTRLDQRCTGHGVRDRDDHQGEPPGRADRRGADHAAPRRAQGARAASARRSATAGGRCASS